MLLNINTKTRYAEKRRTERLQSFGLDERALQDILFRSLDCLFPEDELILLALCSVNPSHGWQKTTRCLQSRKSPCESSSASHGRWLAWWVCSHCKISHSRTCSRGGPSAG